MKSSHNKHFIYSLCSISGLLLILGVWQACSSLKSTARIETSLSKLIPTTGVTLEGGGNPFDGKIITFQHVNESICSQKKSDTGVHYEIVAHDSRYWLTVEECQPVNPVDITEQVSMNPGQPTIAYNDFTLTPSARYPFAGGGPYSFYCIAANEAGEIHVFPSALRVTSVMAEDSVQGVRYEGSAIEGQNLFPNEAIHYQTILVTSYVNENSSGLLALFAQQDAKTASSFTAEWRIKDSQQAQWSVLGKGDCLIRQ